MDRALELARTALGTTSPNPAVGALIVKDGLVVGEGFTQSPGGYHAEIVALKAAGTSARGATLFTTLEPCCHEGRTPPCTKAIIEAGISTICIAAVDPNPKVNGKGIKELADAGITVQSDDRQEGAEQIIEAYSHFIKTGRPFVVAKFATSLDGKIATTSGDSKWITSQEARSHANALRGQYDAVMVGVKTVIEDNPQLTLRQGAAPSVRQPLRIVVDSHGRTPPSSSLLREAGQTLIAASDVEASRRHSLEESGAEILLVAPSSHGGVDLGNLLQALAARDVTGIMVEGGGRLLGSLFDLGFVDKVLAFVSPTIIGGASSPSPVSGRGATRMSEVLRLERTTVEVLGGDVLISGYPVREAAAQ
jgi:diaminohydroxyphosphoribosylaminopyrimidine deaminase/5-amino-6-(5-phosphoribosylamino)uracil reductase